MEGMDPTNPQGCARMCHHDQQLRGRQASVPWCERETSQRHKRMMEKGNTPQQVVERKAFIDDDLALQGGGRRGEIRTLLFGIALVFCLAGDLVRRGMAVLYSIPQIDNNCTTTCKSRNGSPNDSCIPMHARI